MSAFENTFIIETKESIYRRLSTGSERKLTENYSTTLKKIRKQMHDLYEKHSVDGVLTHAEMTRYNRLDKLFKEIARQVNRLTGKNRRIIKRLIEETYQESYFQHAYEIDRVIAKETGASIGIDFGLVKAESIKASTTNPLAFLAIDDTKKSLLYGLQREITQGLINGESYFRISSRVRDAMGVSANRALTIARTEGGRAMTQGQIDLIDQAEAQGVELKRKWIATMDGRTRDSHRKLDGKYADKDGYFTIRGRRARGPRLFGIASEDINCRCDVRPVLTGYEPKRRRARTSGDSERSEVIDYTAYENWKKSQKNRKAG